MMKTARCPARGLAPMRTEFFVGPVVALWKERDGEAMEHSVASAPINVTPFAPCRFEQVLRQIFAL